MGFELKPLGLKPLLPIEDVSFVGHDLSRPECVLVQSDGSLYVSHTAGGVTHISSDLEQTLIGTEGLQANGADIVPNGIFRCADGSFLIANIGEGGGVWKLSVQGELTHHLMEVDKTSLAAANFVTQDTQGRTWITVSTVSQPRFNAYSDKVKDGLIIVEDEKGARIVCDDICFANECRVSPDGTHLYISETFARQITRFRITDDNRLVDREVFCRFGYGDFPDGCCFDADGNLWVTSIVSNRLYAVTPAGDVKLVIEDAVEEHIKWVEDALAAGEMGREHFYKTAGKKLKNIASIAIGGPSGRQLYMGALADTAVATAILPADFKL
ncbi:SMP-30/gluconolactonase/LRE family protein [Sneathiella limimaris]|uniref:SMP-30/gluconolactonase/LRE family protein n=1 Tax=Sneathiella limimaris TaxID=1964213 RepID=UPI00146ED1FE|nr:SMP-30/gluconolactonase/LRE family protein [Sneathiella limimaris]